MFGTKRDLFIATMGLMHARIEAAFRDGGRRPSGIEAMVAMGDAYKAAAGERDLLLVQLHAFAASEDEEIRRVGPGGTPPPVDRRRASSPASPRRTSGPSSPRGCSST